MPEGPEIRRAADQLAKAVVGQALVSAFFAFPALKQYEHSLVGRRIEAITPHGKALLTRFDNGLTLYSHNQLYGVWKVASAGTMADSTRSLRVALATARKTILLFSASDVAMWRSDEIHQHPFLAKLGPDVLDESLSADAVFERLADKRFSSRSLTALLLDQGFLAGMGNYLRSEVLYQAGIAPQQRPCDLDEKQGRKLAEALLDLPRRSYRTRGIRPARGMKSDYLTDTPRGFSFLVFDREGEPCPGCGQTIERHELGGRRLYWCRRCQL